MGAPTVDCHEDAKTRRRESNGTSQYDSLDTILEDRYVEVQEQAYSNAGDSKVAKDLRLIHRVHSIDRLDFKNEAIVHDDVEALFAELLSSIKHRNSFLAFVWDAAGIELDARGSGVNTFQQSRTQRSVDGDAAANRAMNQRFELVGERRFYSQHRYLLSVSSSCLRVFVAVFFVSSWSHLATFVVAFSEQSVVDL